MRRLTATLCLTLVVLLFSPTEGWSADFQKGGDAYERGDYATALREWEPLAEQGHAAAQFLLGAMHGNGHGVPQNHKTAVKWYRLAAAQRNDLAQYNLGLMYYNGDGVPQDDTTAVKWWKLAAEQGLADAQTNLGTMFYEGEGVIQDNVYAHMWWNIAASSGNKDAVKKRDIVAEMMTPDQIADAQKLARECVKKNYTGC
jgi:TPR repeat protein